ncbi:spore germination protein [Cohnella lubricantis]|uniref:Spore germination protein n=2 Tax=Cohnella lubricantis TaxID=2163172 RepID=A0A841T9Q4_9BACL|nr:spore germination protein [Cohnella lubricantis]
MILPKPIGRYVRSESARGTIVGHRSDRPSEGRDSRRGEGSRKAGGGGSDVPEPDPEDRIAVRMEDWLEQLHKRAGYQDSFDVQVRQMTFADKRVGLLFLSTFTKDTAVTEIIKRLTYVDPSSVMDQDALEAIFKFYLPANQVQRTRSFTKMVEDMLIGNTVLYVEGEREVLLIDAKQFPSRTPDEPVLEKVVRGSKDGFTETLLMNVALVRRRIRDPRLRFEMAKVGTRTQTDVAIGYIEDIANPELLESLRDKIQAVNIDGIPLGDKQLEEMTVKSGWNPYPLVRYSERPDVVAEHLLNGSIVVIVDTSPSVMLLPTTYFDLVQHAEENRQSPFIGTYLRWVRFFGILSSVFLLPIWYLFAQNPWLRPDWLAFLGAEKTGELPLILQFLLVEVGIDLMRLAAVHTPTPLVTAMSLVSAILVGDIAVKTGLFINEVILYMAVSAIGMFATPSYELSLANRIVRLALLVAVFLYQVPGFVICATAIFIGLTLVRSFNAPYMWPFIPFNAKALMSILLRMPQPRAVSRPSINRSKKMRKQPVG